MRALTALACKECDYGLDDVADHLCSYFACSHGSLDCHVPFLSLYTAEEA
ncbi:hypothetical protein BDZ89DRAFT_1064362 [Hymenopellis radicata]|nr:hypothetical protein BDZ89DRAFT_1064362 [Hymenopellis radicata]